MELIDEEKYLKNYQMYRTADSPYRNPKTMEELPFGNKMLPSLEEGVEMIKAALRSGKPFMLGRLGETELRVMMYGMMNQFPIHGWWKKRKILQRQCANWCEGAGFYPKNVNLIPEFTQIYEAACKEVDILAVWYNIYEDYVSDNLAPQSKICRFKSLNSFFEYPLLNPWTEELQGKKVLVVSPFANSIEKQYQYRESIYPNPKVLPEFELQTIRAVESPIITGKKNGYRSWFTALEGMKNEIAKRDFDVALLGCGAYGFPLAAEIKKGGRMAIQLCGQTQLLFGIKGHRWENEYPDQLKRVENEYWVRPSNDELPKSKSMVENGCYW